MGFLQPLLLWGGLLVSVPIIIHLINRRRFQRRPWAAMEFLLRALKKNRRRLRLENLLLLLVRVAVLLLLAAAMARPFLRSTAIGVITEKEQNWIFAIDTSYSMGFKEGPRSLFERARESIQEMVQNRVKPRDRVAIVTLDANPQVILGPTPVTDSNHAQLLRDLGELAPGWLPLDLTRSLQEVRAVASRFENEGSPLETALPKKVILLSDFQKRDWVGEAGPRDPAALSLLTEIQEAGGELFLGMFESSGYNLSVMDLSVSPEVLARDVWAEIRATIRNWGTRDFDPVELKVFVDGREEAGIVLRVGAGETVPAPAIPFRFVEPGYHVVAVELRADGLVADNRRFLAVHVKEEASVLLVDGEPGPSPRERETLHLLAALSPDPSHALSPAEGRLTPYLPVLRTADQLADADPRDHILVVLANVRDLPERFARDLLAFVRDGGALMVFLGKNVDPIYYNRELFRDGAGPLPARLEEVRGEPRAVFHLVAADPAHRLVRYFEERKEFTSLLQEAKVIEFKQFYRAVFPSPVLSPPEAVASPPVRRGAAEGAAAAEVRVPFRYSDPEECPAVIDAGFGRGRALWFTTTADREWTDFPSWPDFVALLYQSIPYLVRFGETNLNLELGEPFRQVFEASEFAQEVALFSPEPAGSPSPRAGDDLAGSLSKPMTKLEGENRFQVVHEETGTPGIYELRRIQAAAPPHPPERAAAPAAAARLFFTVNLDPREGDLRPLAAAELREHFPSVKAGFFDAAKELEKLGKQKSQSRGTEMWRPVIWAVFILLLVETLLAQRFGRHQR